MDATTNEIKPGLVSYRVVNGTITRIIVLSVKLHKDVTWPYGTVRCVSTIIWPKPATQLASSTFETGMALSINVADYRRTVIFAHATVNEALAEYETYVDREQAKVDKKKAILDNLNQYTQSTVD
jgi:hypothetical protein